MTAETFTTWGINNNSNNNNKAKNPRQGNEEKGGNRKCGNGKCGSVENVRVDEIYAKLTLCKRQRTSSIAMA